MFEYLSKLPDHIMELSVITVALGLFALMFMNSSIMLPPSELICTTIGFYAAANGHDAFFFVVLATVGNFLGTSLWFVLGRVHRSRSLQGRRLVADRLADRALIFFARRDSTHYIEKFEQYGWLPVFSLRLVPLVRSIVSYPAGRSRLGILSYSTASLVGILLWCSLWVYTGFFFGQVFNRSYVVLVSLAVAVLVWLCFAQAQRILRRRGVK